jgi:hypothetical protein
MGVLGPIVQTLMRTMFDVGHDLHSRSAVGSKSVCDHTRRLLALLLQQPGQNTLRRLGITPGLHDFVTNIAVLVHRPPLPMPLARDTDHHLIEMPDIGLARGPSLQAPSVFRPEFPRAFRI